MAEEFYQAKTDREKQGITLAYMTAYWQRFVKRMPDLNKLLAQEKPKNEQTLEEMFEKIKQLNAIFGGTIKSG